MGKRKNVAGENLSVAWTRLVFRLAHDICGLLTDHAAEWSHRAQGAHSESYAEEAREIARKLAVQAADLKAAADALREE